VGRLLRTRGRIGEFIAEIYSNQPGRAERLQAATLALGERKLAVDVENLWYHGDKPIFKFVGIDSISEAEVWEGAEMLVDEVEIVPVPEGEFRHSDLIGCTLESGGETIGVVDDVQEYGGPAVLRILRPDGREILVPFVRAICQDIDIAAKRIRADLPEGLVDL
jgi:16S rRNA processing protein RimM